MKKFENCWSKDFKVRKKIRECSLVGRSPGLWRRWVRMGLCWDSDIIRNDYSSGIVRRRHTATSLPPAGQITWERNLRSESTLFQTLALLLHRCTVLQGNFSVPQLLSLRKWVNFSWYLQACLSMEIQWVKCRHIVRGQNAYYYSCSF